MDSMTIMELEGEHPAHSDSQVDSAKILMMEAKERRRLRFQNAVDIMPSLGAT
jgi:hypothetical protein